MIDLDEIRQHLAAANGPADANFSTVIGARSYISLKAPVWLADLCDEIERLRAHAAEMESQVDTKWRHLDTVVAERDVAREALVADMEAFNVLTQERDAALAECERLRNEKYLPAQLYKQIIGERDAWRACADQLKDDLREALSYVGEYFRTKWDMGAASTAVYERLKLGG